MPGRATLVKWATIMFIASIAALILAFSVVTSFGLSLYYVILFPMGFVVAGVALHSIATFRHKSKLEKLHDLEMAKKEKEGWKDMEGLLGREKLLYGPVYTQGAWITAFQEMDEEDKKRRHKK